MSEDRKMPLRRCGQSGLWLSAIGLGLGKLNLGDAGPIGPEAEARVFALLDLAVQLGVTHWDTASGYSGGNAERLVGRWFAARGADARDKIILTTKWWCPLGGGRGLIRKGVDGCLRRLQTDYIDIFMLHNPMYENGRYLAPIEETWEAMDELVSAGKVHYLGISNAHGINLRDAAGALEAHRAGASARLAAVENVYNLATRQAVGWGLWTDWVRGSTERAFLDELNTLGLGLIPYWPMADGALSGRYRKANIAVTRALAPSDRFRAQYLEGPTFEAIEELGEFADRKGIALSQLAVAWLLSKAQVSSVIVGTNNQAHLESNAAAAWVSLSPEEIAQIEAIAAKVEKLDDCCERMDGVRPLTPRT